MTNVYEWVEGAPPSVTDTPTPPPADDTVISIDGPSDAPPDEADVPSAPDDSLDTPPDDNGGWDTPGDPGSAEPFADNWNIDACDLTDTAVLDIARSAHLARFELWMKWPPGRGSVRYRVAVGGRDIGGGVLKRGACDPIQGQWCVGADAPDAQLSRCRYTIIVDPPAICQNAGSNCLGFIRAWGE
jgi:hypothetical protein